MGIFPPHLDTRLINRLLYQQTLSIILMGAAIIGLFPEPNNCESVVRLSATIGYYEPVKYNRNDITQQHHRVRRSTKHNLKLQFNALKREFKLVLRHDGGAFTSDALIETSDGIVNYDTRRAYIGYLLEEPESFVHGTVSAHGHFEGKILLPNHIYTIERATRYLQDPDFHTVIYHHSAIELNSSTPLCHSGLLHNNHNTNNNINATESLSPNDFHRQQGLNHSHHRVNPLLASPFNPDMSVSLNHLYKLSSQAGEKVDRAERSKRDTQSGYHELLGRYTIDQTKTTCLLYMQADHLFYEKHGRNLESVIEVLTQHVQGVNAIYRTIDFDHDSQSDNINFIIKRLKVHTNSHAHGYKFNGNFGVEKYLELFSEANYDDFCLAYMFTYRDFEGGTLGLAWTGDLHNAGGVCEKNGFFRGSMKSLNSGIVTTLNYGKDVPTTVSHVTLAHEMGHNMGSQHDPDTEDCSPGGQDGNYIMFARATSGDRENNNKFSRCSKESMSVVMAAKGRGVNGCFIIYTGAICGNEVVEPGEDCDCGWEEDCHESCCYPQRSHPKHGERPCMYRTDRRVDCSPSEGPCCTSKCQLISPLENKICREETSCTNPATCDGYSASCPEAKHKANRTRCEDDYVCFRGECTGSICLVYGLESCQCAPTRRNDWKDAKLCHLCCKEPGPGKPCRSTFEWNHGAYRDLPNVMAKPGMPCNDYMGYCDVFAKCREVDPSGPLSTLRRYLFSDQGMESMRGWLKHHWYLVAAVIVGMLVFLALFVKMCNRSATRRPRRPNLDQWDDQDDMAMASMPMTGLVKANTPPARLHAGLYPPGLVHYSVDSGATVVPCCYNVSLEGAAALPLARTSGLIPSTSCTQHKNIICHLDPFGDEEVSVYSQHHSQTASKGRGWV